MTLGDSFNVKIFAFCVDEFNFELLDWHFDDGSLQSSANTIGSLLDTSLTGLPKREKCLGEESKFSMDVGPAVALQTQTCRTDLNDSL